MVIHKCVEVTFKFTILYALDGEKKTSGAEEKGFEASRQKKGVAFVFVYYNYIQMHGARYQKKGVFMPLAAKNNKQTRNASSIINDVLNTQKFILRLQHALLASL
eukprot:GEMP01072291.1.p1 GENE.GEMP01072291.1~~GEMP01072291.1.p1  ORF type:complete len:105 (-),score=6.83 GEMP01072291.1:301-615(-)